MRLTKPDILIVEDEELNRDIMARRLGTGEYDIRFAEDGQKALDEVADKKPDLILLDIMLPEIMGLQVLHTLRQSYSMVDLPIIMVTAIDEDQRIVRALELGANDYATKPINFPILLARMQTQLCLQQLSALNKEFITTASRDLVKPLDIIYQISNQACHNIASGDHYDTETMMQDMKIVAESSSYMQGITECILDNHATGFGQIRLTKAPLHVESLINELVDRYRELANEKKISLISKHSSKKWIVEADKTRITQVLDKYLSNAIKYCSEGDGVSISVQQIDNLVRVDVTDSGPGLADDEISQLFLHNIEQNKQAASDQSRSGLSLPVCKQLIDLHEGQLGAFNNEGEGATFWFALPVFKIKSVDLS